MSGVECEGGGVLTSRHTINLCKPIAIAVVKMLGVGGVVINSLFYRCPSYCLARGPRSSIEIDSTCDFQGWESEPQVPLMKFINTSKITSSNNRSMWICLHTIARRRPFDVNN